MRASDSNRSVRKAPASYAQRALWVLSKVLPDHAVYNEGNAYRLKGTLDIEAFSKAVNEIARRHETLRMRMAVENGEPVQLILPKLHLPVHVTDLSSVHAADREKEAQRLAADEAV